MNDFETRLTAAGYRFHEGPHGGKYNDGLYQKRVRTRDGRQTAYFVNVYRYPAGHAAPLAFEAEVHLFPGDDDRTFVKLQVACPASVEQVERFADLAYAALGCVPDRHNND